MSQPPDTDSFSPLPAPASLAAVGIYPGEKLAHERGLVALSMGEPYWIYRHEEEYHLLVSVECQEEVSRELAAFEDELAEQQPSREPSDFPYRSGALLPFIYCTLLAAAFLFQQRHGPWIVESFGNNARAVIGNGEWGRTATALFLHSDLRHLLGNLGFGVWFGVLVARGIGPAFGWSLIFLSGMMGNALAAWVYFPANSNSIGASTAVFGALGILVGNGLWISFRDRAAHSFFSRLVPLGGGIALLGLTGAGGMQTDLVAHVTGFACGLVMGIPATWLISRTGEPGDPVLD